MKTLFLISVVLLLNSSHTFCQRIKWQQTKVEKISHLKKLMDSLSVPAVSIAIINNYQVAWAKAYGIADKQTKRLTNINTLFQAASMSKTVNAILILKLVQSGKLSLNKDFRVYLRSWVFPDNQFSKGKLITLRDILSHESGIGVHGFEGYSQGKTLPNLTQILNGTYPANNEPIEPVQLPGKEYYSGGGIMVVQKILADNFKESYADLVRQNIFTSLVLKESNYNQPLINKESSTAAKGYHKDSAGVKEVTSVYPELAAAGLWTTPSEMAKIIIALQKSLSGKSETLLPYSIAVDMTTPVRNFGGMGVALNEINGYKYFYHNGENQGFCCEYMSSCKGGYGIVVMTNGENLQIVKSIIEAVAKVYKWPGYN
ncbi:MAG: beta-lactamase family protein [Bacteroidota bacterium]|nr:beta-lactamase family protein [Bacteroidota bacterium]